MQIAKNPALAATVKKGSGNVVPMPRKGLRGKKDAKCSGKIPAPSSPGTSKGGIIVPFRESVLTWYLRESLSGNARFVEC